MHLNKTNCNLAHGGIAAEEQLSGLSVVSVVSAAPNSLLLSYSPRKAINGSTRDARRAGKYDAAIATTSSANTTLK